MATAGRGDLERLVAQAQRQFRVNGDFSGPAQLFQMIEFFGGISLDIRLYILICLPVFCLFSLIPDFSYLMPFSMLGFVTILIGIAIVLYYILADVPSPARLSPFTEWQQVPIFACVLLFATHNMTLLMPLENSMEEPGHMPAILTVSMIINCFCNVAFGFLGYNKYFEPCNSVVKNLPLDEILAQTAKMMITLSIIFTYGLHYYIPIAILWPMIAEKVGDKPKYEKCFRIGGVIVCSMLTIALPHLTPLLSLFTALTMTTTMLLIPIVIECSTKWNDREHIKYGLIVTKNIFIALLWLLLTVSGTYTSILVMIEASEDEICN